MVVLDTTVVSELMRPSPAPAVEAWVARRPATGLFFTAVGEAELRYGLSVMPADRRRDRLAAEIEAMLCDDFEGRVLSFDGHAARAYAEIAAARRPVGRPVPQADGRIAAIARARGKAVATRNVLDFESTPPSWAPCSSAGSTRTSARSSGRTTPTPTARRSCGSSSR